jgi:uncharacterized protein (DUF1778 family)
MPRVVPEKDKKKARMEMRITEQDQEDFAQAAEIAGANDASEWARTVLRVQARELISKRKKR